jgi:FkbM family methyltransferase
MRGQALAARAGRRVRKPRGEADEGSHLGIYVRVNLTHDPRMTTTETLSLAAGRLSDAAIDKICRSPRLARGAVALANRAFDGKLQRGTRAIVAGPLRDHQFYVELPRQKYFWLGSFEPWVQQAIVEQLRPGSVAWDLGAFTGFHTLLLRKIAGRGKVVSVEPDHENRRILLENLRINGYGDVKVIDSPVLNCAGAARLDRDPDKPSMSRIVVDSSGDLKGVGLDELLANCPTPHLVKVDIEGMEGEALAGAERLVHDVRPVWIVEKHGDAGERAESILRAAGYELTRIGWWLPEAAELVGGGGDHFLAVPKIAGVLS